MLKYVWINAFVNMNIDVLLDVCQWYTIFQNKNELIMELGKINIMNYVK